MRGASSPEAMTPSHPASSAARRARSYRGRRRRVLVVDDNAANRAVLTGWLDSLGFEVSDAAGGEEQGGAATPPPGAG